MESGGLIDSFKAANQSLRKRAITLGVLLLVAIALKYSEQDRFEQVSGLVDYQSSLAIIYNLPDSSFKDVVNGDHEQYFTEFVDYNLDRFRLFEKVKEQNYERTLVSNTIDEIENKIEILNKNKSIDVIGITIPLEPIVYLSLIFILIVFHDFSQIVVFRNQVFRRLRTTLKQPWELGFEFFGFYNDSKNSGVIFLKAIASIITTLFIISPIATSLLILGLNRSGSMLLGFVNASCLIIIVIDTIVLFYVENRLNFRFLSHRFLGKHNLGLRRMRVIWLLPIVVIITLELIAGIILSLHFGTNGIFFFLLCVTPLIPLYFVLERTFKKPNYLNRSLRSGLLLLNIYWVISIFYELIFREEWLMKDIELMAIALLISILFSGFFGFIYGKYFISRIKVKKYMKLRSNG